MAIPPAVNRTRFLETNRASWNKIAHSTKGKTALPQYGPLCPNEHELGLLGDVAGKRIVELGCGDGKSIAYLHTLGAEKLCGIDLASEQIELAKSLAEAKGFKADFFCSPMEVNPGLPHQYFDIALSLYALGWSVDIDASLTNIVGYLKPGGMLIYSWEHPVFSCLKKRGRDLYLSRSYSDVGPVESLSWNGDPIVMHSRQISTFLNATIQSGLILDSITEGELRPPTPGNDYPRRWYSQDRARMMPTTLIVKAHKPLTRSCPPPV